MARPKRQTKKNSLASSKKGVEMSFNMIFVIIVGAFILFLAIYFASKLLSTGQQQINSETATQLLSVLDPYETGLSSGKSSSLTFLADTRSYFSCSYTDNRPFGKQTLEFQEKSIGDNWGKKSVPVTIKTKYVFSENLVEGKKMIIFSKPLVLPFKIADVTILFTKKYCFYKAPAIIKDDLSGLNIELIQFSDNLRNCSGIKVCFEGTGCDINVKEDKVIKNNKELYYVDNIDGTKALVYGAIFSNPEIYECNVKRLMNRMNELSKIYNEKMKIIEKNGCSNLLGSRTSMLSNMTSNQISAGSFDSSKLKGIYDESVTLDLINDGATSGCEMY